MAKEFTVKTKTKENDYEMYFRWYIEELIQHGYVKRIDREPELISVFPKALHKKERHLKKEPNKLDQITLLQETNYTYDFRIIWTEKSNYIFHEEFIPGGHFVFDKPIFVSHKIEINGEIEVVSYVDVKPHFAAAAFGGGKNASYYTFPYIQKYLFLAHKLYINKIIPIHTGKHGRSTCLFATTFVPNRYRYTNQSRTPRKIPYRVTSMESFVKMKSCIIEKLLLIKQNKESQQSLL